jgi:REP element-mobilizing transposase RayT
MPQSFVSLNYHLIYSTKNREPVLSAELRPRLFAYVGGLLRSERACLLAASGMPDHAHWLVSIHQQTSVADLLRLMKSASSRWIHETFTELRGFGWQAGYGAFSVSYSGLPRVRQYIDSQEDHHRIITFQDEFLLFLRRHRIEFDERYLWD